MDTGDLIKALKSGDHEEVKKFFEGISSDGISVEVVGSREDFLNKIKESESESESESEEREKQRNKINGFVNELLSDAPKETRDKIKAFAGRARAEADFMKNISKLIEENTTQLTPVQMIGCLDMCKSNMLKAYGDG